MSMCCKLVAITSEELAYLVQHPDRIFPTFFPDEAETKPIRFCDLDKAWHGLHYLLTGTAWNGEPPLSLAILGEVEIGEDIGYGPARYLIPEQVRTIAAELDNLTQEVVTTRVDPIAMNDAEIYPFGWEDGAQDFLLSYLALLRQFYREAADDGLTIMSGLT